MQQVGGFGARYESFATDSMGDSTLMCCVDMDWIARSNRWMLDPTKACPIVLRKTAGGLDALAFRHPMAGKQLVKGTINAGETAQHAAQRELFEESGLCATGALDCLGKAQIGTSEVWAFYVAMSKGLPDRWKHQTLDDHGHVFDFFWHPIGNALNTDWDPIFHEAQKVLIDRLTEIIVNDISYL